MRVNSKMISYEMEMLEDDMLVRMESKRHANRELAEYTNWANWTKSTIQQEITEIMGKSSSESKRSYSHHSMLSHPSISSISSAENDIVKITLRDPGVTPPVPPEKDKHHLEKMARMTQAQITQSAPPQSQLRTQSDTILYQKETTDDERRSGGLVRKKAAIYARVPLMLSPEPCFIPSPARQVGASRAPAGKGLSNLVSMEKIKSNGMISRTQVKFEPVVEKAVPPLPVVDVKGDEITKPEEKEDETVVVEIFPKIVCGLPCLSKEREEELTYTLEILSGIGVRRVEEFMPKFKEKEV